MMVPFCRPPRQRSARAGTPPAIINRYHEEMVRILNSPDIQKRLHEMEFEIVASSPKQFSDWIGRVHMQT